MDSLVHQIASLLADSFVRLMSPRRHASYEFEQDEFTVRVTVEIVTPKYETETVHWAYSQN